VQPNSIKFSHVYAPVLELMPELKALNSLQHVSLNYYVDELFGATFY